VVTGSAGAHVQSRLRIAGASFPISNSGGGLIEWRKPRIRALVIAAGMCSRRCRPILHSGVQWHGEVAE
jgi:hypothetical protein